ncbi:MAG: GNAT family protein [Sneathiella sp.]
MRNLTTKNLLLRPFRHGDLAYMQRYATREDYYRFLPLDALTPASVEGFLKYLMTENDDVDSLNCHFAIEPISVGHIIGTINLRITDAANKTATLGYALDSDFRGNGYMSEAIEVVLDFGFNELSMHRIWASADTRNKESWRVMERAGLEREGLMRNDKLVRGEWVNSYLYAILRPIWNDKESA